MSLVTVHQGRNLRAKGKNGTNDAYAIMQVAKDKFSTSVASFDLPLFHPGNAERCTLHVAFLGQAVVNLLDLHDNNSRKKTDWFKLVDKSGKEDKANNMSASMFDLSMQDKPLPQFVKEELPSVPHAYTNHPLSSNSTNPFEDISLSSDRQVGINESPADHLKSNSNPQPLCHGLPQPQC
uniref:C2 domain-containing protein n=1 Tax=Labrus bergylta TaxID=56723 RepID=A0A3Q3KXT1_9LABR